MILIIVLKQSYHSFKMKFKLQYSHLRFPMYKLDNHDFVVVAVFLQKNYDISIKLPLCIEM